VAPFEEEARKYRRSIPRMVPHAGGGEDGRRARHHICLLRPGYGLCSNEKCGARAEVDQRDSPGWEQERSRWDDLAAADPAGFGGEQGTAAAVVRHCDQQSKAVFHLDSLDELCSHKPVATVKR
jgi:hypothetical protein